MIAVVDYGVGNLFSLKSSLKYIGADCIVSGDAAEIKKADSIILPGVGAFRDARRKLDESGLADVIGREVESGKPLLGICLGMQLLFDRSTEYGVHGGLGFVRGSVEPIREDVGRDLKIPHMGWNSLDFAKPSPLFKYINNGDYVYFVHSYHAKGCEDSLIASTYYGAPLTAAVQSGNVFGTQFHPEKSGETGLNILRAFAEM